MRKRWWQRLRRPLVWSCAALLTASGTSSAGDADTDLKALIERQGKLIEAQGKQLEELKKRLETISSPVSAAGDATKDAAPAADKSAVQKIVADYLTEQDKKKKADEDKKKQDADEKKKTEDAQGKVVGSDLGLTARWNHGLWVESADKAFRVHVGGRTQIDSVWMKASDDVQFGRNGVGRVDDAIGFRRARLAVEGTFWEVFDFNCEYDFMNTFNAEPNAGAVIADTPVPTDLYLQVKQIPYIGNIRLGHQKMPISFEHLTSSRFLNFMERSLTFDAWVGGINNGFLPGIQAFHWTEDERATWAIGVFKNNQSVFGWNVGDGEMDVTGRVTFLPWYEHDGRCLLHVGLGASHRAFDDHQARYRSRALLRNGPAALHTPLIDQRFIGDDQTLLVPELVLNVGPFTLQAEYFASWTGNAVAPITPVSARRLQGTLYHQGTYVEMLYFLTGEHRRYDRRYPRFDRVIPLENAWYVDTEEGHSLGRGAWQVAARYSYIDLNDGGVEGGTAHDFTVGLNWFLNPNTKIQWNYSIGHRDVVGDTSDGVVQGFGMRLAIDF